MKRFIFKLKSNILPVLLILLIPLVNILYGVLNNGNGIVHSLVTDIDRMVPFVKAFVVPYVLWYPFLFLHFLPYVLMTGRFIIKPFSVLFPACLQVFLYIIFFRPQYQGLLLQEMIFSASLFPGIQH